MCKLLTIDALFLNEDRHTHNISVLMSKGGDDYKLCPIYDNGGALLSDMMMDFPLGEDVYDQIDRVRAKTFCDSFDEQLDIAEKLYGSQISFSFSQKDIRKILENQKGYPKEITDRVEKILLWQFRKYSYLFKAT